MIKIEEIEPGVVAWPDPSHLTAAAGCSMPYSIHNATHPMLCIEANEDQGVWIGLSSRPKTMGGRIKMEIPRNWKIGSESWIEKPSYIGDLTTSVVIPHDVMERATEKAEFSVLRRHRVKASGVEEILRMVKRAEGKSLESVSNKLPRLKASGSKVIQLKVDRPVSAKSEEGKVQGRAGRFAAKIYDEILARAARGETAEEIAKNSPLPMQRIERYLAKREGAKVKAKAIRHDVRSVTSSKVDLESLSMDELWRLMAIKEREQRGTATQSINEIARKFGFSVAGLDLRPLVDGINAQVGLDG